MNQRMQNLPTQKVLFNNPGPQIIEHRLPNTVHNPIVLMCNVNHMSHELLWLNLATRGIC